MSTQFRLVTGRTRRQADGLHQGKDTEAYRQATERVGMNADDMARLGISDGAMVKLRTPSGSVEVPAYQEDLPSGLLFMPLGPVANRLIDVETEATGTPGYKGLGVSVAAACGEEAANG